MASDAVTERLAQVRARHAVLGQALDALADRRHDERTTGPDHDPDGLAVIEACREEIDDFAILGMWAIFEEALHDWMDARVRYGDLSLTAAVARDNVVGVQFHPEKSGVTGIALLRAFVGTST